MDKGSKIDLVVVVSVLVFCGALGTVIGRSAIREDLRVTQLTKTNKTNTEINRGGIMHAQLSKDGELTIIPDTPVEVYAMKKWLEENANSVTPNIVIQDDFTD